MVGSSRRWLGVVAASTVVLAGFGCGGDSKSKTITVAVQAGESAEDWHQRALTMGQLACTVPKPPERVAFVFPKADKDTDVAADVAKLQLPMSADCSAYQGQVPEEPSTSAKP